MIGKVVFASYQLQNSDSSLLFVGSNPGYGSRPLITSKSSDCPQCAILHLEKQTIPSSNHPLVGVWEGYNSNNQTDPVIFVFYDDGTLLVKSNYYTHFYNVYIRDDKSE